MKERKTGLYKNIRIKLREYTTKVKEINKKLELELREHKKTISSLKMSNIFLENILQSIREPLCIFNKDLRIIYANDEYAGMKGVDIKDIIGKKCYSVFHRSKKPCRDCIIKKTIISGNPCAKEKIVKKEENMDFWWELYTYPVRDEKGDITAVIEYSRDITERKKMELENFRLITKLREISKYDDLTGLLNRKTIIECLHYEFEKIKRYGGELSIIFTDVDNFKEINDTCGHMTGDTVLKKLADTLKSVTRKSDILGRYGGDEFLFILPGTSSKGAKRFCEKIRNSLQGIKYHLPDQREISITLSSGIAVYQKGIKDLNQLIQMADQALYQSKKKGKNMITIYSG